MGCVHAVSGAIEEIDGIDSVHVSLKKGKASIKFKPGSKVTQEQIRKAIQDRGFTSGSADVKISGKIIEQDSRLALDVSGLDSIYLLEDHVDAKGKVVELKNAAMNKQVIIDGHLMEKQEKGKGLETLQVRDFSLVSK